MAWAVTAVAGSAIIGGVSSYLGSQAQAGAARDAANAQSASAQAGINEQRRQFDAIQALLQPYTDAGPGALKGQQNLIGLNGADAQKTAINGIEQGPQYQSMVDVGENALRQNAAATGGLRGGNLEATLAQFRPQVLSQLIQQQFGNLGSLTTVGQNSAAMTGTAGQNSANQITNLLGTQGSAQANSYLNQGRAAASNYNTIGAIPGQAIGNYVGLNNLLNPATPNADGSGGSGGYIHPSGG
jgi:hypothetical protein